MAVLSQFEVEQFEREGGLTVPNAVSPELLGRLQQDFNNWVEESKQLSHLISYTRLILLELIPNSIRPSYALMYKTKTK